MHKLSWISLSWNILSTLDFHSVVYLVCIYCPEVNAQQRSDLGNVDVYLLKFWAYLISKSVADVCWYILQEAEREGVIISSQKIIYQGQKSSLLKMHVTPRQHIKKKM